MEKKDPLLARLERDAIVWCLAAAAIALVVRRGRPDAALGVLAGGLLIGVSYWAIKSGIDGLLRASAAAAARRREGGSAVEGRPGILWPITKFVGRYGALAVLAYVMIVWLRLDPIGLLVGVSSIVAAAAAEALRTLWRSGSANQT